MTLVQIDAQDVDISDALRRELERSVEGEVRFDKLSRALYSTDASVYQIEPAGVLIPKTREDILHALAICRKFRCPITMRGGGTSQAGQAIGEGLQIDTSKYLNRLLDINVEERWVRVEPGIVLDELNAQIASSKLRFAPDISTASRATIGGMIANNSAGARSVLYGKTIDHVISLTMLLSDGTIAEFSDDPAIAGNTLAERCRTTVHCLAQTHAAEIDRRYPKILRRVGGYNLDEFANASQSPNFAKIIVGSEGTLGIVLEAKLRLVPLPQAKAVMVIHFADLLEALAATPAILRHAPSAIEVMDKSILDNTRDNDTLNRIRESVVPGDPAATLCVEFYADTKDDLPPRMRALEDDLRDRSFGYRYDAHLDPAAQAKVWSLREAALGLSTAMKGDAKSISFVEDTAVAPERLSEYIGRFLGILRQHGAKAGIYAHASVGCLHVRPVINLKTRDGVAKFEAIANAIAELVLEYGGALSGEHGDGLVRGPFMERMFGPDLYGAFREIKRAFDPEGIFNPGKIVDSPPLTANLRFGSAYRTPEPRTWFDYSDYGGFGRAVEMCSGVGACRKKVAGTMCPSYMVTRDETASTRGRANALRAAMTGVLDESGLGDDAVYSALDLCLECRACKTECPANVDMARFKSEFLADYYDRHGTPVRARALGNVHRTARWGSRFASIANRIASSPATRRINETLLGIDSRRTLPAWRSDTLERTARLRPESGTPVALFNDTFTNHYDPEIGLAAIEILERAGSAVTLVRPGCCGRPLISQGLLREAQRQAETVVDGLYPIAERGEPILFLEPSCLSAIRDDMPGLLRGESQARAQKVAAGARLFEEYAAGLDLRLRPVNGRILVHGHCHQKSMGLLGATMSLLSRIPDAAPVDLDAGCCGMAGSFGYTRGHYDVSVAIANRKLIPAARAMNPGDVLIAPGTSCRHQVADLAQVAALHPAQLIRSLLL
jgi:FAD/FMN-containing dehydrogenase/Fe-S oxidoreductase